MKNTYPTKLFQMLLALVITASFAACGDDDDVAVDGTSYSGMILSVDNLKFALEGGTKTFKVESDRQPSVSSDADWLSIQVAQQEQAVKVTIITVTATRNNGKGRSAVITVSAGSENRKLDVTQEGTTAGDVFSSAMQIAKKMYPGWNLGNTMEPPYSSWMGSGLNCETAWQPTKTTQAIINLVKESGFNSIRIPCSWDTHSDSNGKIDAAWMARVKEVVDYCINAGLYVMLNDHWDNGWIEVNGFTDLSETNIAAKEQRMTDLWTQIATAFRDYDEHLLFAGLNEPNADNQAKTNTLIRYEQAFINAVRATGGNNATRVLIIQGPSTDINRSVEYYDVTRLNDSAQGALMVEIHYYDPGQFCGTWDATGSKAFYYWGAENHTGNHDANWGEETYMAGQFAKMKNKYTSKGYPVVIGEYAGQQRTLPAGENQTKHDASVKLYYKRLNEYAVNNGMVPFAWDTNSVGSLKKEEGSSTILDRAGLKIIGTNAIEGIKEGAAAGQWPIPNS